MLPTEYDLRDSPCCGRPLILVPLGLLPFFHYKCGECNLLLVWNGRKFLPCEFPHEHSELSHAGALRK